MKNLKYSVNSPSKLTITFIGIWFVLVIGYIGLKGGKEGWNNTGGDFNNYYVSSVLFMEGEPIANYYDNAWFAEQAQGMEIKKGAKFAPFPPLTTFLYAPLSVFDHLTAKRVWLIFNCLLLFYLPFRLSKLLKLPIWPALFVTSLFFVPLSSNLNFGQAYLLLTIFMLEAIGLVLNKNKSNLAVIIIGICALLKYFPLLFVAYFYQKKTSTNKSFWQANRSWISVFLISTIGVSFVSYLFMPEAYSAYFDTFTDHIQGDLSGQGKFAIGFQSIDSLLNNLFIYDQFENSTPLVSLAILKPIFKVLITALLGLTCFLIFRKDGYRFTPINSSLFIIGAFILIPASASYHFLFLIIPAVFVYKWLSSFENWTQLVTFILLLLLSFCIQYHHIPEVSNYSGFNLLIHYPRLWSMLILFGYLSYLKLNQKEPLSSS